MKTNTKQLRNTFLCILAVFLTAGIFTGCGESDSQKLEAYNQNVEEARNALNRSEYMRAHDLVREGAENGHVKSQALLGVAYMKLGQHADGYFWIRRAAEAGDPMSQINLALCYTDGKGVKQNSLEASHWKNEAVKNGYTGPVGILYMFVY